LGRPGGDPIRAGQHKRKALAAFAALLVIASSVRSAEELDVDLMHEIEDTNKSLASNIALKDAKASGSDAKSLAEAFATVESYYVKKGDAPDAVELAKKSKELSAQIEESVSKNDFGTATDTATRISRNCKTCHSFYKKS
jgi:hypothetical protein